RTGNFTSSCAVSYRPTSGAGTHTVRADYNEASSALHATSHDSFDITVTLRVTMTSVSCDSPVAINQASTCTATVADVDYGTKSPPSGTVNFALDGPGSAAGAAGSFSNPGATCTLAPASSTTSSCQVD